MMPTGETMRDRIIDAALRRARAAGYDGFSFRDIAVDVGIKSASVHYHFPTKPELTRALIARYQADLLAQLSEPGPDGPDTAIGRLVQLFRKAATGGDMCLCAALGGTPESLPSEVREAVAEFGAALIRWLDRSSGEPHATLPPASVVALLEGALLLANLQKDAALFDQMVAPLSASINKGSDPASTN